MHNFSKTDKFMHTCTIAQYCALSEYCAWHNCGLWPRVLSIVHIYVVQHVKCAIVHYFDQFVPTLGDMWHFTCVRWNMTHDTWHATGCEHCVKTFRSLALMVLDLRWFTAWRFEGKGSLNQSVNQWQRCL